MANAKLETIVLGAGCFWCSEAVFLSIKGVEKVISGYAGGTAENPTYELVCTGTTGHAEVVKIEYDPKQVSFEKILRVFFKMHDPTTPDRQGNDYGPQYRSIILYATEAQKQAAEDYVKKIRKNYARPIATEIKRFGKFYAAEGYHHKYYERNPDKPYCRLVIEPKLEKIKRAK